MPTVTRSNESSRWIMREPRAFSARVVRPSPVIYEPNPVSTRESTLPSNFLSGGRIWKNVGSSRVRASEASRRMLERFYHLKKPTEILRFLGKDDRLFPLLVSMYPPLHRRFGNRKTYLEVVSDPEFEDERLGVFVVFDGAVDDALESLERFDEEWWSEVPGWLERKLTVSVEFE